MGVGGSDRGIGVGIHSNPVKLGIEGASNLNCCFSPSVPSECSYGNKTPNSTVEYLIHA